ncbi:hypothetical protein D9615_009559 [Tricholomella constricta]|uniref:F-box domain-containing protein n=1 Tax=Tricholomella constricta TaxID=117010 RepID=A0A8H5LW69_9AGAR|nr:hypothetical protein D9615_009559 [Tricholomella constricta]
MTTADSQQYPPELLFVICAYVYSSCLHPAQPSLDPLIQKDYGVPTALPSSIPASNWPEPVARRTLANLCLVNHAWYEAAKPWLWTKVEVRLPRSWLSLVEEIAWEYDEETVDAVMGNTIKAAAKAAIQSSNPSLYDDEELRLEESILETFGGPDLNIAPELLSPAVSRDPSPRRLRPKSKSPARWKLMRSISDAIQNVLEQREPGVYVPTPNDPRPGRFVRHLDFNHFRTIGMRRSIDEGVNSRFVTGDRVQAVLKEMPNLTAFGATEYMDGALTLPVLNELFLRGAPSRGRGRPSRGRGSLCDIHDIEEEDRERRRECRDLEAVDLTGCVSAVFVNALTEFVNTHLLPQADAETSDVDADDLDVQRSPAVRFVEEPLTFPGLQRLGLRGVKSIMPRILSPFVLAFPSLTHLDLSGTRVTPDILYALGDSSTIRLQSLALARCIRLTSASIKALLVDSQVTSQLKELNLYGDMTFTSPLLESDLRAILTLAPCFLSGKLVYLDLSSAPLTRDLLNVCRLQPKLRSLGLSHIPNVELKHIAEFVKTKSPNVEILTLIGTSPELDCGLRPVTANNDGAPRGSPRQSSVTLHTHLIRPLCTPPFSFSLTSPATAPAAPPTRLRVIELSTMLLGGLGAGAGSWRIVKSKGGRGWYVDTASGWVAQVGSGEGSVLRRDLMPDHPFRIEMEKLSSANGNVSSGVGWHARKMEVLHGHGMLGREDGLYGAVSFAYQG